MKELAIKIRHRCNTKEIWESANPLLEQGEIGIQIPTANDADNPNARWFFKFGDGKNRWNNLPWASAVGDLNTDISLSLKDAAADAWAVGERLKEIEAKLYSPVSLSLSDSAGTREKTTTPPTSIVFNLGYENEVDLETGVIVYNGKEYEISKSEMQSKKKTISGLTFTMQTNNKSVYEFTFKAKEIPGAGNNNTAIERTAKGKVTFADYVRYGFGERGEDDTAFIAGLANKTFDNSKDSSFTPSGKQYFYICYPSYLGNLAAKVNAFTTDFTIENATYEYGENLKVPYKICRSPEQYTEKIPIYFKIG